MNGPGARVTALSLSGDAGGLAAARKWIDDFLSDAGVQRACIDDAVLVVSELTSNAVRHGAGAVLCQAVLTPPGTCFLSVADFGDGRPGVVARDREHMAVGGLGLVIVERLAREWGVADFDGGKAVFAVLGADMAAAGGTEPDDAVA